MRADPMLKGPSGASWEFDGFQVMTEMRLLLSGGTPVPLTAKAFDTLMILIENRDRVVTKNELLRSVWPDVDVEEGNLTQQIFLLRKALGETAQQPRCIITVPGHGYRFTARVTAIAHDAVSPNVATGAAEQPSSGGRGHSKLIVGGLAGLTGVALIAWAVASGWMKGDTTHLPVDLTTARITKVTENGKAPNGAISSDGRYVAYIENDGDEYSLWVRQTATGGKAQVVPPQPQALAHLAFGPGGEYIYFARGNVGGGFLLSRVPAIGGLETPILDDVDSPVSFSPDGRQFAFMRGAGSETQIVVAAAGGSSQRILATRTSPLKFSFIAPDWSPDGTMVAAPATDQSKGWRSSIIVIPAAGGRGRELYTSDSRIGRARWLPDGSGLLAVVSEALSRQFPPWQSGLFVRVSGGSIWRIPYPNGRAEQLTSDLIDHDICCLDIGANGRTVLSVVNSLVSDLWIASTEDLAAPRQLSSGNPVVSRHSWLADNDTIVYRDLNGSLKAVHKDGWTFALSLPDGYKAAGGVSACGDGRYVTFQAVPGNNIWRVKPSAGGAMKLTSGVADSNPACSHDGKWVVYSSMNTDTPSLRRVSIEGGEPTPLVETESFDALPSPSGQLMYYSTFEWEKVPAPRRVLRWIVVSSTDHKRRFVLDAPTLGTLGTLPAWAPDESGLDYIVTRSGVSNIWRQPFAGGPPVQITQFRTGRIFSFAWSPDGRWLSFASGINRSDVVLISREP